MILTTAAERQALLLRTRTIAVVGVSPRPARPSYRIFQYLRTLPQYETMPVNPRAEAIDGLKDRIVTTFERLEGKPDGTLGPGPLHQKRVLTSLIRRR